MKKVYLSTPYSHDDEDVRNMRYEQVTTVAAEIIMLDGHNVFSPITHSHPLVHFSRSPMPDTFDGWEAIDYQYIDWCDELLVLMLPGWDRSRGVANEVKYAIQTNTPVIYIEADAYGT